VWQYNEIAPPTAPPKKKKKHHKIGGKKMLSKSSCDKSFQKKLPTKIENHQILFFLRFSEKQISKNKPLKTIYLFIYYSSSFF
jgi:hypothetical protein